MSCRFTPGSVTLDADVPKISIFCAADSILAHDTLLFFMLFFYLSSSFSFYLISNRPLHTSLKKLLKGTLSKSRLLDNFLFLKSRENNNWMWKKKQPQQCKHTLLEAEDNLRRRLLCSLKFTLSLIIKARRVSGTKFCVEPGHLNQNMSH